MQKPPLLFGTPRSGSTLAYAVLEDYYKSERGLEGLREYFNLKYQSFWDDGTGIRGTLHRSEVPLLKPVPPAIYNRVGDQRLHWLKKYHGRYFCKIMTGHLTGPDFDWFFRSYEWIFVERRNLFEQLVSFLISALTGHWYLNEGIPLEPESLTATSELFTLFENHIFEYNLVKHRVGAKTIFSYEDFLSCGSPEAYLSSLGLKSSRLRSRGNHPRKQNNGNKLLHFKNPDFIVEAYKNSELSKLSPPVL